MLAAAVIFGLSVAEAIIVVGATGYIVSLVKDWRPMKSLRAENKDLRERLDEVERGRADDRADYDRKIASLEGELERLKKATDLTVLQTEHREIAGILRDVVGELRELHKATAANTVAVEILGKRSIIDEALADGREEGRAA